MGIRLENVNYVYAAGTAEEKKALDNINLTINDGEFIGLVGHTGSGNRGKAANSPENQHSHRF